jgi:signal peptidase
MAALCFVIVFTFLRPVFHPESWAFFAFLAGSFVLTWLLMGFRLRLSASGAGATQIMLIYLLCYLILIYLLGLFTGFLKNSHGLAPLTVITNLLPILAITTITELWRYTLVKKAGNHQLSIAIVALFFAAVNIMIGLPTYDLATPLQIFEMAGKLILGGIAANFMLTFVAHKSDFRPALTYALVLAILPVVAPILPDIGAFISAVLAFVLPLLLLMRFNSFFAAAPQSAPRRQKRLLRVLAAAPAAALLVSIVVLVSGVFRYQAMAIGSDSMRPLISTGDVVVVDKHYGAAANIALGSIIAFKHEGKIITHRLIDIKHTSSGLHLQTKGDNNQDTDAWVVSESEVVGVVRFQLPLIGLPTVWLDRAF